MISFYFLILIIGLGFGVIALVLLLEKRKENHLPDDPKITATLNPEKPLVLPKDVLERVAQQAQKGTPPPAVTPTAESTKVQTELSLKIDELSQQLKDEREKYSKLDTLFQEKSSKLDKSEKALTIEQKNQKDFHKVQDILEKELKDTKDKVKTLSADLTSSQTETQLQTKRVSQLEEKIKKCEATILSSETAVKDAQAETQLARKTIEELEARLREKDNQIIEKNQKIEHLVEKIKDLTPKPEPAKSIPDSNSPLVPEQKSEIQKPKLTTTEAERPKDENEKQGGGETPLLTQMEHTPPQLPEEQPKTLTPVEPIPPPAVIPEPETNPLPEKPVEAEPEPGLKLRPDSISEPPQEPPSVKT